jgi:hypothetical protein
LLVAVDFCLESHYSAPGVALPGVVEHGRRRR